MKIEFKNNKVWLHNDETDRFSIDISGDDDGCVCLELTTIPVGLPANNRVAELDSLIEQLKRPNSKLGKKSNAPQFNMKDFLRKNDL